MMKPKAAVSALLAVALVGGVAAATTAAKTVLRVSTWPADASEKLKYDSWEKKYEKANPGIDVKVEVITGDYFSRLLSSYAAGKAPDIYRIACSWNLPAIAGKNMLMAIPDAWMKELGVGDLLPAVVKAGTYKGKFYGWDPHLSTYALHYNKTLFDKAGLVYPDGSWTWDSMALAADKLTQTTGAKTSVWGFECDEGSRYWANLTWCYGGELFDALPATKALYPSDESLAALRYMQRLSGELQCSPKALSDWRGGFRQQKIAMVLDGIWMNPYFVSNASLKHGTAVVPHDKVRATVSVPCLWGINAATKNKLAAWRLLKSWCGVENSLDFTDYGGPSAYGIPVWKSALKDSRWRTSDLLKAQFEQMDYARPEPSFRLADQWMAAANTMVAEIMAMKKDPAQAMGALAKRSSFFLR